MGGSAEVMETFMNMCVCIIMAGGALLMIFAATMMAIDVVRKWKEVQK
jgi:hypothetical protein